MQEDILQSEGWEKFQRALGRKTERISSVLAIEMPLPFGKKYLYSPRSGVAISQQPQAPSSFCESLQHSGITRQSVFFRAPFTPDRLAACGLRLATPAVVRRQVEPEWTWRTSLEGPDDVLLERMHEKHRYNIRLAVKRGVIVRATSCKLQAASTDFVSYWDLLQETAKRQGISTHPRHYYETMLATLPSAKIYFAEHSGTPIACAIIAYHDDTATYLHGGSSYEHRSFMAPHLLHWTAMRDARVANIRWYEWGGIQPEAGSRKPEAATYRSAIGYRLSAIGSDWSGITRFKRGFGGEAVHHPPMRDLVFRPKWYTMLSWFARLRR